MKKLILLSLSILLSSTIFAQMGPGGGGWHGGGGGDRRAGQSSQGGFPGMPGGTNNQQQGNQLELGDGKIKGSLVDSVTKKPVEFATIALFKKSDRVKPVDGTMSDELGKFALKDLPDGEFFLKISFIGYEDRIIDLPSTAKAMKKFSLMNTILSPSAKLLDEVTVTGQKSLLEDKVDRLIFNAEVDKTSQGGNAGDVLKKVPMLSVDLDGNVSLRGNSNIKVLINNKPSTIMASSIADALKQIPAEMIKTVEVITSPSAKYDAEGTTGIINIITKKNNLQGITGMVNTAVGNRGANLFGNVNYRQGKLGVSMNGGGNMFYNPAENTNNQTVTNSKGVFRTEQFSKNFDNGMFGNWALNSDYDLNTKNSITAGVRVGQRGFNNTQDLVSKTYLNNILSRTIIRDIDNKNQNINIDLNLDYIRKFENPQKEFGIILQRSQSNNDNSFTSNEFTEEVLINRLRNNNTGLTNETTFQMDFQTPLKDNQIIEMGVKNIFRNIGNDYGYEIDNTLSSIPTYKPNPLFPANSLSMDQNISSAYLSYTLTTKKKFSFKPGLRYEYTLNDVSLKDAKLNVADYGNLVPSLQLSKNLGGGKTIKTSFNRRIQRPNLRFLSPNVNTSNPLNISQGNPELLPELTNSYELGFSAFKKATSMNISLFFRDTKDNITQIRTITENGGILSKFENAGTSQTFGANLFGSTRITQKWQLNLGTNVFYQILNSPVQKNEGLVLEGNLFLMGQLGKGYSFQSFGFLRGPQVQPQGRQAGFGMFNMGVKKDFKNKKGSFGVSVDNPFTRGLRFRSYVDSPSLYQENINLRLNRGVKATFSYQFGKMTFGNMNRRSRKLNNDDSKQDDSGNQGGGGGMQGGAPR